MRLRRSVPSLFTAVLFVVGCGVDAPPTAPDPGAPLFAKPTDPGGGGGKGGGGKGGGGKDDGGGSTTVLVADVVALDGEDVASTCAGEVTDNYGVLFRHTTCLRVPLFAEGDSLRDDISLNVKTRKGQVIEMYLTGQDVVGEDGIMHETDNFLTEPFTPDPGGFTVQIDASVPIYRLSGHLRGKRVGEVGTLHIGEIVYRQP